MSFGVLETEHTLYMMTLDKAVFSNESKKERVVRIDINSC